MLYVRCGLISLRTAWIDCWLNSIDCYRLTHITLDNVSDDADTAGLVYEYNKQNDVRHQRQQQTQTTSSTLLDKLQSRIETRNQLNAAKSRLVTDHTQCKRYSTHMSPFAPVGYLQNRREIMG